MTFVITLWDIIDIFLFGIAAVVCVALYLAKRRNER